VTEPSHAVFVSYASQDAEVAARICAALSAADIEVWFDQSELRGGDAWDQSIRRQIRTCALFIPVISQNTHERAEGYFRLEWKLAVDRCHLMAADKAFLLPVVIDDTPEDDDRVPERFREVQWTRLPAGETPPQFVRLVSQLLTGGAAATIARQSATAPKRGTSRSGPWLAVSVVLVAAALYLLFDRPWITRPAAILRPATPTDTAVAFAPPARSIAVLPFVNMSGDKEQEYFSDGLTEELLDSLTRIKELHVAARTSAFSFKGKDADVGTIARKLNVATVLEGSVRRSTHTVRITAQLVDAVSGFHVWSQTYNRNLGDFLALETDIATAVANALKVTLLGDAAATIELGGTRNPAAFDAYLRGMQIARTALRSEEDEAAIAAFTEAVQHDRNFAKAFAERSVELNDYGRFDARGRAVRESFERALTDARTAVTLAPALAEGHLALAVSLEDGFLEFAKADEEFERAAALAPGSARMLSAYSRNAADLGRTNAAIDAARRAVALDPLNFHVHRTVGIVFILTRQYADAIGALRSAVALQPDYLKNYVLLGQAQYSLGDFQAARSSCERGLPDQGAQGCLAIVYRKLGREADAEAMVQRVRVSLDDTGAYDLACIYAQRGEIPQALQWLETAMRHRDPDLFQLKVDPDLDPLRGDPRFQAIERELNFPN
jgi:TolB-like protein/Tfp pilus assembly protein PilF